MDDLKEETISSQQLYNGKLLHVFRDKVQLPDGNQSEREWIDHPGAAAVLPLFENGTVMMVRQYRYPARKSFLELPAGKFDDDREGPQEVAARELEEETGWRAASLSYVGHSHPCIGYSNEIIHYFLGERLERGEQNLQDAEFVEVVSLPLERVYDMAAQGEIDDMKTVAGLYLIRAYLERRARENGSN